MEKQVPRKDLQQPPIFDRLSFKFSAFDDGSEEEEKVAQQSAATFLVHKFREFYIDNIPVELVKQLPSCWKFLVGLLCYALALLIFIYFTITNYESAISSQFISLDDSAGDCLTVPISVTASYFADGLGNWEGTADFLYYQAPYQFEYNNFVANNPEDYIAMMAVYYRSLSSQGKKANHYNLAPNLVLWMSWIRFYSVEFPLLTDFSKVGRGNLQYIQLTGDPSVVFSSRYSGLALGSSTGICQLPAMVIYDPANALFRATINQNAFLNASTCSAVTTPFLFQQNKNVNPYFSIQMDVRSFAIAMGVNFGFNDIRNLMQAGKSLFQIKVGSTIFSVGKYFDIRFPEMESIFCLYNTTALPPQVPQIRQLCLIATGSSVFLPVFNHMGNNLTSPEYCDCANKIGTANQCQNFFLMAGLIAFDSSTSSSFPGPVAFQTSIKRAMSLVDKHNSDYFALNRAAFEPSAASVFYAMNSADPSIRTAEYFKESYGFCRLPGNVTCSLITFYTLDQDNVVSDYHYSLPEGSCKDTITPNISSWVQFAQNSPTPLTQIYFKCASTAQDALINAVGVASGNTSIAMLVLLFVSVPIVFGFMACFRVLPNEQEYREKEKTIVLDTLATLLLRARDEHHEAMNPDGTIAHLTDEMILATNFSHYEQEQEEKRQKDELNAETLKSKNLQQKKSFKDYPQQRERLGKENIYRALQHHSSKLNVYGSKVSPMKIYSSGDSVYSKHAVIPDKEKDMLNRLELGPTVDRNGLGISYDEVELEEETLDSCYNIKVMNLIDDMKAVESSGGDPSWLVPYHENSPETVIHGLSYYFTLALQAQTSREKSDKPAKRQSTPLYQTDIDFSHGYLLSNRLLQINAKDLIDQNDPALFVALANALGMHASLMMGVDMKTVARNFSDKIGYQIGDKIFTYSTLVAFSLLNPAN